MKYFLPALRMLMFMTLLTGVLYPLLLTGFAQGFFSQKANGSLIEEAGVVIGSNLLSQKFTSAKYFWGRPSAVDFNPLPSGGSNLGPTSAELKKLYDERLQKLKWAHQDQLSENLKEPPQDLLFASGSGLDPEISPAAAQYQMARVARARGMSLSKIQMIVSGMTQAPQWGIFGEARVNVLTLNLALNLAYEFGHEAKPAAK